MKTLIVHPDDRTTDLLKPVYKNIVKKTGAKQNEIVRFNYERLFYKY